MGILKPLMLFSGLVALLSILYAPSPPRGLTFNLPGTGVAVPFITKFIKRPIFNILLNYCAASTYVNVHREIQGAALRVMFNLDKGYKVLPVSTSPHPQLSPSIMFEPKNVQPGQKVPILFYIHGGSYMFYSPEQYTNPVAYLGNRTGCLVISLRYRLAPEHVFPAAVDDVIAQMEILLALPEEGEGDPLPGYADRRSVLVTGDSAGGNLAINVAMAMPDKILAVVPIYPTVQMLNLRLPSAMENWHDYTGILDGESLYSLAIYITGNSSMLPTFNEGKHVSTKLAAKLNDHFRDVKIEGRDFNIKLTGHDNEHSTQLETVLSDYRLSPLIAPREKLIKIPAVSLFNCHFDAIRDDGALFARRLKEVGVPTRHYMQRDCFHGVINFIGTLETSKTLLDKIVAEILFYLSKN